MRIAEIVQVLLTVSCVLWGMGALKIEESAYFRHSPHKKEEAHVRFFALFYEIIKYLIQNLPYSNC